MNPFIKSYLDQIDVLVGDIEGALERYDARLQQTQEARETLMKQYWSVGRQLNALQETIEKLPALEEENHRLRDKNQRSAEHARRILECSKALSEAMQP